MDNGDTGDPDDTTSWFLDSFKAAKSTPFEYDFPELDESLRASSSSVTHSNDDKDAESAERDRLMSGIDWSKPGGTTLEQVFAGLSTRDEEDESNYRSNRTERINALESLPLNSPIAQGGPRSNFNTRNLNPGNPWITQNRHKSAAFPQLLPISRDTSPSLTEKRHTDNKIEPGPIQPGNTTVIASKLNDEDWDYLHALCSYMDTHPEERITKAFSYNSEDARNAALALGLPEPNGLVLELLVGIGLNLGRFSEEDNPWCSALNDVERLVNSQKHAEYLETRRSDQESLALELFKNNTAREYLAVFRNAYHDDIVKTNHLLKSYDVIRLKPRYFANWLHKTRVYSAVGTVAKESLTRRLTIASFQSLKSSLEENREMKARADTENKLMVSKKYLRKLSKALDSAHQMSAKESFIRDRNSKVKMFHVWLEKRRAMMADDLGKRVLMKGTLKKMQLRLNEIERMRGHEPGILLKKHIHSWQRTLGSQKELVTKYDDYKQSQRSKVLKRYLGHWLLALKMSIAEEKVQNASKKRVLKVWKMESICCELEFRNDIRLMLRFVNIWRQSVENLRSTFNRLDQLISLENQAITHMTYNIIRGTYLEVRLQSKREPVVYAEVLKKKFLKEIQKSREHNLTLAEHANQQNEIITKHKFYNQLLRSSESNRLSRLARAQDEAQRRVRARMMFNTLSYWNQKAKTQRNIYNSVARLSDINTLRALIAEWNAATLDAIALFATAEKESDNLLAVTRISLWRNALGMQEEYLEAANDFDISRMAGIFKLKLRRWQQLSTVATSQEDQAKKYLDRQIRSASLSLLQNWHDQISSSDAESAANSSASSLIYPANFSRIAGISSPSAGKNSPRRKFLMSPQALQRWKANSQGRTSNNSGINRNDSAVLTALSPENQSRFRIRRNEDATNVSAGSPTKPTRSDRFVNRI